jgi:hypothetical protein
MEWYLVKHRVNCTSTFTFVEMRDVEVTWDNSLNAAGIRSENFR